MNDNDRQVYIVGWLCVALMAVAFASCTAVSFVADAVKHQEQSKRTPEADHG